MTWDGVVLAAAVTLCVTGAGCAVVAAVLSLRATAEDARREVRMQVLRDEVEQYASRVREDRQSAAQSAAKARGDFEVLSPPQPRPEPAPPEGWAAHLAADYEPTPPETWYGPPSLSSLLEAEGLEVGSTPEELAHGKLRIVRKRAEP